MKTIDITLSLPSYASTYAELGAEHLKAAVEAYGSWLQAELTARTGAAVEVSTTRDALLHDRISTSDGSEEDVESLVARIADGWWKLSDEERQEYGFPVAA